MLDILAFICVLLAFAVDMWLRDMGGWKEFLLFMTQVQIKSRPECLLGPRLNREYTSNGIWLTVPPRQKLKELGQRRRVSRQQWRVHAVV